MIESIDWKLISVCLIHDYSLITDLHIFVDGRAECATISLECTKVKFFKLNDFESVNYKYRNVYIHIEIISYLVKTNNIFVDCTYHCHKTKKNQH